jgi:hypothetical protein
MYVTEHWAERILPVDSIMPRRKEEGKTLANSTLLIASQREESRKEKARA